MRKLLLLFLLCGSCTTDLNQEGIVQKVEMMQSPYDGSYTYRVTIKDMCYHSSANTVILYTDSLYCAGDTIYITKK